MDYVVLSTLSAENSLVNWITFSYDISCQWSKNLLTRFASYPPEMVKIDVSSHDLHFAIPKFHLPGHGKSCQIKYSFNYLKGSGRTCGEGIEQGWASQNPLSMSTREMGPGARSETLDDHWNAWNFRKLAALGMHDSILYLIYNKHFSLPYLLQVNSWQLSLRKRYPQLQSIRPLWMSSILP